MVNFVSDLSLSLPDFEMYHKEWSDITILGTPFDSYRAHQPANIYGRTDTPRFIPKSHMTEVIESICNFILFFFFYPVISPGQKCNFHVLETS